MSDLRKRRFFSVLKQIFDQVDNDNTDGIHHADISFIETQMTFLTKESRSIPTLLFGTSYDHHFKGSFRFAT